MLSQKSTSEWMTEKIALLNDNNLDTIIEAGWELLDDMLTKKQKFAVILLSLLEEERQNRRYARINGLMNNE